MGRCTDTIGATLIERLRALSRIEHDDLTIGKEAADEIEALCILLRELRQDRDAALAEVARLRNNIHSCGPTCDLAGCVNARLRSAMASTEEDAALWEERARHLGWKDAHAPNVGVEPPERSARTTG